MKVLFCIDHLRPHGTQRVLVQLIEGLNTRGRRQSVLCLNDAYDPVLVDRLRRSNADVRVVGKAALVSGMGLPLAWRWIRGQRFDVAVTFLFYSDVLGRALARSAGVPRIVTSLRARNTDYAGWQRWLVRRTMRWADAVVLNSGHVREFAISEEGAPADHIHIIPNGVEAPDPARPDDASKVREELGLASDWLLVGSLGRLAPQKGYDVLFKALALMDRRKLHVVLAGTGKSEDGLRALAVSLGIRENVHFIGFRRDTRRLLDALDLYVQPSRFEGMPNALLEAMAAGRPIVASSVDGIRELIDDGVHGWLAPPDDPRALAQVLTTALRDPEEARRRAEAARHRAATRFSVEAMVEKWSQVLEG